MIPSRGLPSGCDGSGLAEKHGWLIGAIADVELQARLRAFALVTIVTIDVVVMTKNMGAFDRGLRAFVVAPAALVVAFLLGASTIAGVVLFVVAGVMLVTGATGFCPTYTVVGISTQPRLHRTGHGLRHLHA